MAELVGVVASGAGLVSLTIELIDLSQRFRRRVELVGSLRTTAGELLEEVDTYTKLLQTLEAGDSSALEFQMAPIMMGRCHASGKQLAAQLNRLVQKLSTPSRRHSLLAPFKSGAWKADIDELKRVTDGFKLDVIALFSLISSQASQRVLRLSIERQALPLHSEIKEHSRIQQSTPVDSNPATEPQRTVRSIKRQAALHCSVGCCCCSCHKSEQIKGRFWFVQFSPLSSILIACDDAACTTRKYRFDFRGALTQLGIPWAVVLGFSMTSEPGRCRLEPALEIQRVAKFTAPGFDTLFCFLQGIISFEVAKSRFDELYRTNPGFVRQIDPAGKGFLEKISECPAVMTGYRSPDFEDWCQLIGHFVKHYEMSLQVTSAEILYTCAKLENGTALFKELTRLGFDFSEVPLPNFTQWPKPMLGERVAVINDTSLSLLIKHSDIFFLKMIREVASSNPGFGGTTPLHEAILQGDVEACKIHIQKISSIESEVNFLGQTPLHLAVDQPSCLRVLLDSGHPIDSRDMNGFTPLMYAGELGIKESMSMLIEEGADVFAQDDLVGRDFFDREMTWSLICQVLDLMLRNQTQLLCLLTRVKSKIQRSDFRHRGEEFFPLFWAVILTVSGPDVGFEDGSTTLHAARDPVLARLLIDKGYTLFNNRNQAGEHSLFAVSEFHEPSLLQLCIDKGASVNVKNNRGGTVLHKVVDDLLYSTSQITKSILLCLDTLLDNGANANSSDDCSCSCSCHGCFPISAFTLEIDVSFSTLFPSGNPFWIFEWLLMLEERGRESEAKECAIAVIRRSRFDKAGLTHKCSHLDDCEPEDEEAFWDLDSQAKLIRFNSEVAVLDVYSYGEIKSALLQEFQAVLAAAAGGSKGNRPTTADHNGARNSIHKQPSSEDSETKVMMKHVDYQKDNLFTVLDLLLKDVGEGRLFSFESSVADFQQIENRFQEFVTALQLAREDVFESRIPMLRQIADTLHLPLNVEGA